MFEKFPNPVLQTHIDPLLGRDTVLVRVVEAGVSIAVLRSPSVLGALVVGQGILGVHGQFYRRCVALGSCWDSGAI